MKATALAALFLTVFTRLSAAPPASAADNDFAALTTLAASKRAAGMKFSVKNPVDGTSTGGIGVFISEDGLALVTLMDLARGVKPAITTPDGATLSLGSILGIFPEQELALVKFKHRPKVWLPLAPKEPEINEPVAVAGLIEGSTWKTKVPPITGFVMSKRSSIGGSLREPQFRRVLSLGAGMTSQQRTAFIPGSFAINRQGQLVASIAGIEMSRTQKLILLVPVSGLAEQIAAMAKEAKPIPFPLPADSNPIDLALMDPAFYYAVQASQKRDDADHKKWTAELLKKYPDSTRVLDITAKYTTGPDGPPRLDAKASAGSQVARLRFRSDVFAIKKMDLPAAIRESTDALALSPKDYPDTRLDLGLLYLAARRPADAEPLLREALTIAPEYIQTTELLERLLTEQSKFDEARKFTDRVYDLERLYRAKH